MRRDEREQDRRPGDALEARDYLAWLDEGIAACLPVDQTERAFILEYHARLLDPTREVPSLRKLSLEFWPDRDSSKGCAVYAAFHRRLMKWVIEKEEP